MPPTVCGARRVRRDVLLGRYLAVLDDPAVPGGRPHDRHGGRAARGDHRAGLLRGLPVALLRGPGHVHADDPAAADASPPPFGRPAALRVAGRVGSAVHGRGRSERLRGRHLLRTVCVLDVRAGDRVADGPGHRRCLRAVVATGVEVRQWLVARPGVRRGGHHRRPHGGAATAPVAGIAAGQRRTAGAAGTQPDGAGPARHPRAFADRDHREGRVGRAPARCGRCRARSCRGR